MKNKKNKFIGSFFWENLCRANLLSELSDFSICKKLVFFDKNEGPCGTLSEQSISCFSHCALCSYRGIGEICKSLERERNLPPVIEHTHSPHTPSLLCFKFSTHSFFMRVSKAPSIPSMFYKKFLISSENSYNINSWLTLIL